MVVSGFVDCSDFFREEKEGRLHVFVAIDSQVEYTIVLGEWDLLSHLTQHEVSVVLFSFQLLVAHILFLRFEHQVNSFERFYKQAGDVFENVVVEAATEPELVVDFAD